MVNIAKFRGKMREKNANMAAMAKVWGCDTSTAYRKCENDGEKLLVKDIDAAVAFLGLSGNEAMEIFFAQFVADVRQSETI